MIDTVVVVIICWVDDIVSESIDSIDDVDVSPCVAWTIGCSTSTDFVDFGVRSTTDVVVEWDGRQFPLTWTAKSIRTLDKAQK